MPEQPKSSDIVSLAPPSDDGVSLVRVALVFVRAWRLIAAVVAVAVVAVAIVTFLRPRTYTSASSFALSSPQSAQVTSGLAAQLGINLGANGNSRSPQFYADLVQSRAILQAVAESTFVIPTDSGTHRMTLIAAYRHGGDSPGRARDRAVDALRKKVHSSLEPATGVVSVSVTERNPTLAAAIAAAVLKRVNEFNLRERQLQAGDEREFTEQRLQYTLQQLHAAEDALARFSEENRDYAQSPRLQLESERLQRVVSTKQQVYTSLASAYEQARLSELRDTPVIVPIESPQPPSLPDRRGLLRNVILTFIVAGVCAGGVAVVMEYFRVIRVTDDSDFRELATAWRRRRHKE